jgi:hypothetical protein
MRNTKNQDIKRKIKRAVIVAVLFYFIVSLPMIILWATFGFERDFFKIDSCLDSGGRWDKETRTCEK